MSDWKTITVKSEVIDRLKILADKDKRSVSNYLEVLSERLLNGEE